MAYLVISGVIMSELANHVPSVDIRLGRGRPRKVLIPKSFDCLGHTIQVELLGKDLFQAVTGQTGLVGYYDHDLKTIYVLESESQSAMEQTFLHELMHCILEHAAYPDESSDESFVDLTAELLYQYMKTQKGRYN